jgi:hypothetical protein
MAHVLHEDWRTTEVWNGTVVSHLARSAFLPDSWSRRWNRSDQTPNRNLLLQDYHLAETRADTRLRSCYGSHFASVCGVPEENRDHVSPGNTDILLGLLYCSMRQRERSAKPPWQDVLQVTEG